MNHKYTYQLAIWFLALMIVSCETKTKDVQIPESSINHMLRLNFHDNIIKIDPRAISNDTEQFVVDLTFDKFIESDGTSRLFENWTYDSTENTFVFDLYSNKTFHDGTPVNTEAIRLFYKSLSQNDFDKEPVKNFFQSLEGYGAVNWYRENRNVLDSIPRGFEVVNDTRFKLTLRTDADQLLNWFRANEFTLFKSDDSPIGSGPFQLTELKEDISAKLTRTTKDSLLINTINVSFIKNIDLVYSEFFRGAIDLVSYNPYLQNATAHQSRLEKILQNKYSQYQTSTTNQRIAKYLEIHAHDPLILKSILHSIRGASQKEFCSELNSTLKFSPDSIQADSSNYPIKWYSDHDYDENIFIQTSQSLKFIKGKIENLNPTEPHIVIKKGSFQLEGNNLIDTICKTSFNDSDGESESTILLLDQFSDYVIFSNNLKGISANETLSQMVLKSYFENIKTY